MKLIVTRHLRETERDSYKFLPKKERPLIFSLESHSYETCRSRLQKKSSTCRKVAFVWQKIYNQSRINRGLELNKSLHLHIFRFSMAVFHHLKTVFSCNWWQINWETVTGVNGTFFLFFLTLLLVHELKCFLSCHRETHQRRGLYGYSEEGKNSRGRNWIFLERNEQRNGRNLLRKPKSYFYCKFQTSKRAKARKWQIWLRLIFYFLANYKVL